MTHAIIFDCIGVLDLPGGVNEPLVDFIRQTLQSRYQIGLLSNTSRSWMDSFLDQHQLRNLFEAVVVSGDLGIAKPDTRIYETRGVARRVPVC